MATLAPLTHHFTAHALDVSDIPQFDSLQHKVHDALAPADKTFYFTKPLSFLQRHFATGGAGSEIFLGDKLVAQALFVHPTLDNPATGMADMVIDAPLSQISVLQGLAVDPDMRGYKLGDMLIKDWLSSSPLLGRTHLYAETAQDNPYSWKLFENNGVPIVSEGVDPSDGLKLYNHHTIKAGLS